MFSYNFESWVLEFDKKYRVICDNNNLVVIDEEKTALVLLSINSNNNICIERTYYEMICEIDAENKKITFHVTDNIS